MRPKEHEVLEMAINGGVNLGWSRAHKHTETPTEEHAKEVIKQAILHEIYEWFEIEDNDDVFG